MKTQPTMCVPMPSVRKEPDYSTPIVFTTKQVQRVSIENAPCYNNITYTGATVTATLSIPAGTEITEKGICYSKLSDPSRPLTVSTLYQQLTETQSVPHWYWKKEPVIT